MHPREAKDAFRDSVFFERVDPGLVERLAAHVHEVHLSPGQVLFHEGDQADALYIVVEGQLEAVTEPGEDEGRALGVIRPGEPVGELAVLLGGRRGATVHAETATRLARLDAKDMAPMLAESPEMQSALEAQVQARIQRNELDLIIKRYFGSLDGPTRERLAEQLEWVSVEPGEILFRRGDPGESLYFVVSGSLWAVGTDQDGLEVPIAELGTGEVVGEMGLLSGSPRSAGVVAARPATLVRLSSTTFEMLSQEHPRLMLGITRQLIDRVRRTQRKRQASRGGCRRIAVIAAGGMEAASTIAKLAGTLGRQAAMVSSGMIDDRWGRKGVAEAGPGDPADVGVGVFLDELAAGHDMVFHLTDPQTGNGPSRWSRRCLQLADEILVVGGQDGDPRPDGLERTLYEQPRRLTDRASCPATRLLLLHDEAMAVPRGTADWLADRSVANHYHLRPGNERDVARVARLLSHQAVGIALGGVGFQGLGQIGALQALEEAAVPLDMIAGSGIGAVVGGLYARGADPGELARIDWRFLERRSQARSVAQLFGDAAIEDLWRPFLCVSTNLSRQSLCVHRNGALKSAVLASSATPGLSDPVWIEKELHVNGGLMNRLPGDLLASPVRHRVGVDTVTTGPSGGLAPGQAGWLSRIGQWLGRRPPLSRESYLLPALFAGSHVPAARMREELDLSFVLPPAGEASGKDIDRIIDRGYREVSRYLDAYGIGGLPVASVAG